MSDAQSNESWKKYVTIQTKTNLYEFFVLSVFLYEGRWTLRKSE